MIRQESLWLKPGEYFKSQYRSAAAMICLSRVNLAAYNREASLPLCAMLQTPLEIIQALRDRHPELADHPTLWHELEVMLIDDRRHLNQILQQDAGNAAATIRRHLESILHPPTREE